MVNYLHGKTLQPGQHFSKYYSKFVLFRQIQNIFYFAIPFLEERAYDKRQTFYFEDKSSLRVGYD